MTKEEYFAKRVKMTYTKSVHYFNDETESIPVEKFKEKLEEAIKQCHVTDNPIGLYVCRGADDLDSYIMLRWRDWENIFDTEKRLRRQTEFKKRAVESLKVNIPNNLEESADILRSFGYKVEKYD